MAAPTLPTARRITLAVAKARQCLDRTSLANEPVSEPALHEICMACSSSG
jgi:hypothetical protein